MLTKDVDYIFLLFRAAQNAYKLVDSGLEAKYGMEAAAVSAIKVPLSKLKDLELRGDARLDMQTLLPFIAHPSLRNLELWVDMVDGWEVPLPDDLQIMAQKLHIEENDCTHFRNDFLERLIQTCPRLEEFSYGAANSEDVYDNYPPPQYKMDEWLRQTNPQYSGEWWDWEHHLHREFRKRLRRLKPRLIVTIDISTVIMLLLIWCLAETIQ